MIPKIMEEFLRERLPERTWQNRLAREDGMCFMEFGPLDVDRLGRLGIEVDSLGPRLVACIWNESSPLEIGGYLVVDNLAMGRPSLGGIRMLPGLTPSTIHYLARGMTLKNAAADLPFGGGKVGILLTRDLSPEEHTQVIRSFARLLYRYRDIFIPGPDAGTTDADMKIIAIENGLDNALSKPEEMGGNRIEEKGAAGGGLVIALEALLTELPRFRNLPQCANISIPSADQMTILVQGFGSVGAHAACILTERLPGARVVGVSDTSGYLYDESGLPVELLFQLWREHKQVCLPYYQQYLSQSKGLRKSTSKFSTSPDDLLRESAFCLIPAAPVSNYLDTDPGSKPSMVVSQMGNWSMIIEGANTYSPDPGRKAARARVERAVFRERGIVLATDYLVNSGGVIFAAQERLIKTPGHLRIPDKMLGDQPAVEKWLSEHAADLKELAEKRLQAAIAAREDIIRRNMRELADLLVADADTLPGEIAERISVNRIASRESYRTAADIMERIITIPSTSTIKDAASLIIETGCPILAVVNEQEEMVGVVTDWDITRAAARGAIEETPLETTMTHQVIFAAPGDTILELVRKLEYHEISAMPVVEGKAVIGVVSSDLLARRSLYRLLQTQKP